VTPWAIIGILCAVGAFYATARSLQIGDGVGVIAATAATANLLGIIGGIVVFGDPLGKDPATVTGRLLAFSLAVVAVALVPAPTRARRAVREQEENRIDAEEDERASGPKLATDEHKARADVLSGARVARSRPNYSGSTRVGDGPGERGARSSKWISDGNPR
jgi:hypothetical protein